MQRLCAGAATAAEHARIAQAARQRGGGGGGGEKKKRKKGKRKKKEKKKKGGGGGEQGKKKKMKMMKKKKKKKKKKKNEGTHGCKGVRAGGHERAGGAWQMAGCSRRVPPAAAGAVARDLEGK